MGLYQGCSGLGLSKPLLIPPKATHDYRKFIADDIEKESDLAKAAQLVSKEVGWCDYVEMDLSWKSLLAMPSQLISFCIQSTHNILLFQG